MYVCFPFSSVLLCFCAQPIRFSRVEKIIIIFCAESDISAQQPLLSLFFASPHLLDGAIFMMIILLVLPSLSTFFFLLLLFCSFESFFLLPHFQALPSLDFVLHCFSLEFIFYMQTIHGFAVSETTIKDTGKSVVVVGCLR